jgi:hypothetical protein
MIKEILKEISSSITAFMIVSIFLYIISPDIFLPYDKWDNITIKSIVFLYLYMPTVIALTLYYIRRKNG